MKKYELSEKLLNDILNYLAKKPFNEVAGIIFEINKEIKSNISNSEEGNV